jgi:uncharacterized protein YndB with AHSA1/START domain
MDPSKPLWLTATAGRLFGGKPDTEQIQTGVHFNQPPEVVWRHLMTFEELRGRPSWLLRLILPEPLRTSGSKFRADTELLCSYRSGRLIKHMVVVDPPHRLRFTVSAQALGIEDCVVARSGAYDIFAAPDGGSRVELTTQYEARLHPRWVWRPIEALAGHQFHRHILNAMRREACKTLPLARPVSR